MNLVEMAYGGPEVQYDLGGPRTTGAYDLLLHLDCGLAASEKLARDGTGWRPRFK